MAEALDEPADATGEHAEEPGGSGERGPGRGDDAAGPVTAQFREHHLELVRLALLMVGDLATAEDVVQDAFERLHRHWRGHDPASGLAYARSSVLNGCRSVLRPRARSAGTLGGGDRPRAAVRCAPALH